MIKKSDKVISSVLLGLLSLHYLFLCITGLLFGYSYVLGFLFFFAAIIVVCAIFGILRQKKILLWPGIVLGAIQILDGVSSIISKYVFGDDISIIGIIIVALAYIYPVIVMYKTIKVKRTTPKA